LAASRAASAGERLWRVVVCIRASKFSAFEVFDQNRFSLNYGLKFAFDEEGVFECVGWDASVIGDYGFYFSEREFCERKYECFVFGISDGRSGGDYEYVAFFGDCFVCESGSYVGFDVAGVAGGPGGLAVAGVNDFSAADGGVDDGADDVRVAWRFSDDGKYFIEVELFSGGGEFGDGGPATFFPNLSGMAAGGKHSLVAVDASEFESCWYGAFCWHVDVLSQFGGNSRREMGSISKHGL